MHTGFFDFSWPLKVLPTCRARPRLAAVQHSWADLQLVENAGFGSAFCLRKKRRGAADPDAVCYHRTPDTGFDTFVQFDDAVRRQV